MDNLLFKAICRYDSRYFVEADLNYQSLVVAQLDYLDPTEKEKGQFINIDMRQVGENAIDAAVTLSVEDAEKFANHILGLCQAVKGNSFSPGEKKKRNTLSDHSQGRGVIFKMGTLND